MKIKQEKRKSITWVTPDYFLDTDFNPPLVEGILTEYDIHWIVLLPVANARFSEKDFEQLKHLKGLTVKFLYVSSRARSPKMISFYEQVYRQIRLFNSDLVYYNDVPASPYILPLYLRLNKNKTIVTAHDGNVKPSFKMAWLSSIVFKMSFGTVKFVNTFSEPQAKAFGQNFPKAKIYVIPLGLKNFGQSTVRRRTDNIIFLFFGSIHSNKNLGLLIDAACNLYEQGYRGFKVSINGVCADWETYQSKIKYPDIFECDIRALGNEELPNLFAGSHYAVFPYKDMSQSGALKVAFNYALPVIVSNLEAFTNEVKEGVNGFTFKSEDVKDLERVMSERIKSHADTFDNLHNQIMQYNKENFSSEALISKYKNMLNDVYQKTNKR